MKKIFAIIKDKKRLHSILFEGNDPLSRPVDIFIMVCIGLCVLMASLESVVKVDDYSLQAIFHQELSGIGILKTCIIVLEYVLSILFTIEYILRVYCSPVKKDYVLSFFGIIDLLATLPQLLSIFFPPLRYLSIMRTFRLIRIFRVLKLFAFINEGYLLLESIRKSINKILVYFFFVVVLVCILGTLMFIVEGQIPGTEFTSIPKSIYWAIVTLTTVGYGDITPTTGLGQFLSGIVMILGYTIIAVPTGIVSASMIDTTKKKGQNGRCPRCNEKTDLNANYCKHCGERL
ncbi:MAG: ion transporter [Bacteroidales bacterium]|nr:ion transporter [Bacteroidales bacterium]MDD6772855.1 ion transporter [Bacteroidales bacterium]